MKKEINILRDKRVKENDRESDRVDNERSLGRRDLLRLYKTAHSTACIIFLSVCACVGP